MTIPSTAARALLSSLSTSEIENYCAQADARHVLFEVGEDGYVALLDTPGDERLAEVQAAAATCPTGVITVEA